MWLVFIELHSITNSENMHKSAAVAISKFHMADKEFEKVGCNLLLTTIIYRHCIAMPLC